MANTTPGLWCGNLRAAESAARSSIVAPPDL